MKYQHKRNHWTPITANTSLESSLLPSHEPCFNKKTENFSILQQYDFLIHQTSGKTHEPCLNQFEGQSSYDSHEIYKLEDWQITPSRVMMNRVLTWQYLMKLSTWMSQPVSIYSSFCKKICQYVYPECGAGSKLNLSLWFWGQIAHGPHKSRYKGRHASQGSWSQVCGIHWDSACSHWWRNSRRWRGNSKASCNYLCSLMVKSLFWPIQLLPNPHGHILYLIEESQLCLQLM